MGWGEREGKEEPWNMLGFLALMMWERWQSQMLGSALGSEWTLSF